MTVIPHAARPLQAGDARDPSPYLSVVIPAYNEERRIGPTLLAVLTFLASRPYRSEVVVVSDGSTDATERIARHAFEQAVAGGMVRARFIGYAPNTGKGKAVRTGVLATQGRYVAFVDADLSTPIEEVDRALTFLAGNGTTPPGYRVVIGSRAVQGAEITRHQPLYRRLSAKLFNLLRDGIVGLRGLRDTQCGLKVFDGALARAIFARQRIDGFMFDVETMFITQRLAVPVLELGVRWADAPESKVRVRSGLRLIPDLLRIRRLHGRLSPQDLRALAPRSSVVQ